jgi:hypothetical protein
MPPRSRSIPSTTPVEKIAVPTITKAVRHDRRYGLFPELENRFAIDFVSPHLHLVQLVVVLGTEAPFHR